MYTLRVFMERHATSHECLKCPAQCKSPPSSQMQNKYELESARGRNVNKKRAT